MAVRKVIAPHTNSGSLYCILLRGRGGKQLEVSLQITSAFWTSQLVSETLRDPATSMKKLYYVSLNAREIKSHKGIMTNYLEMFHLS